MRLTTATSTVVLILLMLVAAPDSGAAETAAIQPSCPTPTEVKGFLTCADVDKAEAEGAVVYYGPDIERQIVAFLQKFNALFPNIDTKQYLREQTGRLYAKLNAERQAGTYLADVLALSDLAPAFDFIKKDGYVPYVSPQMAAYEPRFRSDPPGYYTWYTMVLAGIAYNTDVVSEAEAPKSWKDLLDPKWRGSINFKDSASGLQGAQWFMLRKLYGDQFWKDMAKQQPRALPSTVQQYERLINREDKIIGLAQYSTFLEFKAKGAPIAFVVPTEGLVGTAQFVGVVSQGPHPEAAKLFLDWFLSPLGQEIMSREFYHHSPRRDVAPPPGGKPISELNILFPDWNEYIKAHTQYVRAWNALSGLR
ncbi:MAG TPA: extracellular solute-binding protein [Alphaproteobacteria bacterium]|nr:extracellular solute-binding protein [Alphaproteobacteria bacterium]